MKTLSDQNKAVADALIDASNSIDKRTKLYNDPVSGLKALFQQAKAAVA